MHADTMHPVAVVRARRPRAATDVRAILHHVLPTDVRPVSYAVPPPAGGRWESASFEARLVTIADARRAVERPGLDTTGYELREAPSALRDFDDVEAVRTTYYPEMEALALQASGGSRAIVFDHLVRRRRRGERLDFGRRVSGDTPTANGRIHNDYTEASGRRRLVQTLGAASADAWTRRFAIVNLWRSIRGVVLDAPLAVCDARTVIERDLVVADVRYRDRTGEIYFLRPSPRHRWSHFPEMHPDEVLVFKQFDSQRIGTARFTPHGAFEHPHAPADAPPRESIEVRCLVLFDEEPRS